MTEEVSGFGGWFVVFQIFLWMTVISQFIFMAGANVAYLFGFTLIIITVVVMYMKKSIFKHFFVSTVALDILIVFILQALNMNNIAGAETISIIAVIQPIICLIWVPYLYLSNRVKNTFTD